MQKINKLAGYRKMLKKSSEDMARKLNIATTTYNKKENKVNEFKDKEKIILVNFFKENGIETNIEDLFF